MSYPRSAYDTTLGLLYFARMLDKMRLVREGTLPEEYQPMIGEGFDGRVCRFLKVDYAAVRDRAAQGGSDEEILEWCFQNGRRPNDEEILVWNKYAAKTGWRDEDTGATGRLEQHKAASGLAGRQDILTFFDYYDADEGRRA
jgi:Domain of unknown function (DUF5069)